MGNYPEHLRDVIAVDHNDYDIDNMTCVNCIDYMNCFMNQIGIGSGNFAKECSFYSTTMNGGDTMDEIYTILKSTGDSMADAVNARKIKARLDMTNSMSDIADVVGCMDSDMAKLVLKMYIYDRRGGIVRE